MPRATNCVDDLAKGVHASPPLRYRPDVWSEIACNTTAPKSLLIWPTPGAAVVNYDDEDEVNQLLKLRGIPLSADPEENREALDNALRQTFDEQQQVCLMMLLLLILIIGFIFIFAY